MTLQELYQAKQAYYEDWSEEQALEAIKRNSHALRFVQDKIFKGLNFEIETSRDEFNKKLEVLEQKFLTKKEEK
jgi:predicted ATPase